MKPESESGLWLKWSDLESAPDCTGLYAWYYSPKISEADLESPEDTRRALKGVFNRLQYPSLRVEADSHLSLSYSGELKHVTEKKGGVVALTELVERSLATLEGRKFLRDILNEGTVWLSAPIYIGVAESLLTRLRSHKNMMQALQQGTQDVSTEDSPGSNLAREVVERGIQLRHLVVVVLPLKRKLEENQDMSLRAQAESVESVLNRVFFPILGRR